MGSLSSDGCPSPGDARSDGARGDRTLDDSLCAIGGSVPASPRRHGCRDHFSRARDSIHDEYTAVCAPYCNTFCSVHSSAYCVTYCVAHSIAYCFTYCFLLGIAIPLGEGRARLLRSHQPVLLPYFLPYSPECVEGEFSEVRRYGVLGSSEHPIWRRCRSTPLGIMAAS